MSFRLHGHTTLRAGPFNMKLSNSFSHERLSARTHFETEPQGNSEMNYLHFFSNLIKSDCTLRIRTDFPSFLHLPTQRRGRKTICISVHGANDYNILIFSFLLTVLDGQPYSPEQKNGILKEYFSRLEEELLSSPEYYMLLTQWNAFIIIEKS